MSLIKSVKNKLSPLLKYHSDRIVLMSSLSTPLGLVMGIIKLIIGIIYYSPWLLFFGLYYIVLSISKASLIYRYTIIRIIDESDKKKRYDEHIEIIFGGKLLVLTSLAFSLMSLYMYLIGFTYHLSANATYIVAFMGFTKLISSVISLLRSRKFHIKIVMLIKVFNLTNGITSIILTQYAILALEQSNSVNSSTGLFGIITGSILTIIGVIFILSNRKVNKA